MKTLAMDTSNQALSISVTEDGQIIGSYLTNKKKNHSTTLMPAIEHLFQELDILPESIDRVVVAKGPGSYTGLRIGVTTAKTLAWTLKAELVGVSSLAAIAGNCPFTDRLIVPLFDARRQNVYTAGYKWLGGKLVAIYPEQHVALAKWLLMLKETDESVYFIGNDVAQFETSIKEVFPSSKAICKVAHWQLPNGAVLAELANQSSPEINVKGFVPTYLKRVEAEENWLKTHQEERTNYVERK